MPTITQRESVFETGWFDVVAKTVDGMAEPYFAINLQDYVTVLPITKNGEVVLVEQFRPAVEKMTLELPAGHIEHGEAPEHAAHRELVEECGFSAGCLRSLPTMLPDTGRLDNRLWSFVATELSPATQALDDEEDIKVVLLPILDFKASILAGRFDHALHLAVVQMAVLSGFFSFGGSQ